MKTLIATSILIAGLSFNLAAEETETKTSSIQRICTSYSEIATSIMEARQLNAPIVNIIKAVGGEAALLEIIKKAYSEPLYSTKEYKKTAVVSFSNDIFLACYNTYA
jgi:hypothetical protein